MRTSVVGNTKNVFLRGKVNVKQIHDILKQSKVKYKHDAYF